MSEATQFGQNESGEPKKGFGELLKDHKEQEANNISSELESGNLRLFPADSVNKTMEYGGGRVVNQLADLNERFEMDNGRPGKYIPVEMGPSGEYFRMSVVMDVSDEVRIGLGQDPGYLFRTYARHQGGNRQYEEFYSGNSDWEPIIPLLKNLGIQSERVQEWSLIKNGPGEDSFAEIKYTETDTEASTPYKTYQKIKDLYVIESKLRVELPENKISKLWEDLAEAYLHVLDGKRDAQGYLVPDKDGEIVLDVTEIITPSRLKMFPEANHQRLQEFVYHLGLSTDGRIDMSALGKGVDLTRVKYLTGNPPFSKLVKTSEGRLLFSGDPRFVETKIEQLKADLAIKAKKQEDDNRGELIKKIEQDYPLAPHQPLNPEALGKEIEQAKEAIKNILDEQTPPE